MCKCLGPGCKEPGVLGGRPVSMLWEPLIRAGIDTSQRPLQTGAEKVGGELGELC